MDITFVGAARTVTGSLHLFEYKKQKFLLECGLYQGHRDDAERINKTFPFKPKDIKAVLLSHAHIDHSGNLPNLAKRGFEGPIYCTAATKDITSLLLVDSAKIQEYDIEFVNKKHRKNGLPLKEPLYTVADAERVLKQFSTIEYGQTFEPIGRKNMPIIKDPTVVNDIDYLILESTYGSRTHKSFEGMTTEFENIIKEGKKRESKIIIPAFAVERTQLLVTMLKTLSDAGALKGVPVYVDSPLAMNVTEVFRKHHTKFLKTVTRLTFLN